MTESATQENPAAVTTSPRPDKKKSPTVRRIGQVLFMSLLVVLILLLGFASYRLSQVHNRLAQEVDRIAQQSHELAGMQQQVTANEIALDKLQTIVVQQTQSLDTLMKFTQTLHPGQRTVIISQVRDLVSLASERLQLGRDVAGASQLLQRVATLLGNSDDPQFKPARAAVIEDIATLSHVLEVNVTGLYARIAALDSMLDSLPLQITPAPPTVMSGEQAVPPSGWQRFWYGIKDALMRVVNVHYDPPSASPLIAPNGRMYLNQNLHMQLAEAQWALLHQQPVIWHASLDNMLTWLNKYYVANASTTTAARAMLTDLLQVDVRPTVPDVSDILQQLPATDEAGN